MSRKSSLLIIATFLSAVCLSAEEKTFHDVQFAGAKGTLTNASLTFDDEKKCVEINVKAGGSVSVPYNSIVKLTYEYTKKHRVEQGVGLALLSPGTGLIVALTKSRNHWLEIVFHEQNQLGTLVLRLNKHDFRQICDAAKVHTGKEVSSAGRTSAKEIKGRITTDLQK